MKRITYMLTILGLMMQWNLVWASCDRETATLLFQEGRAWQLKRTSFADGSVNTGTLTFTRGTDMCQGTFTESAVGGAGFLTEAAGSTSGTYRVVFTYEAPDPSGREKKGSYFLATDANAATTLRLTVVRKQNGNIKIFNYRRNTIFDE